MTLQSSLGIATEGLHSQSERLKVFANNVANIDTPNYVRKIPILQENNSTSFESVLGQLKSGVIHTGLSFTPGGVSMPGVVEDPTPGKKIYNPNHPEADKDGYVTSSNVNPLSEIADATATARLYEANLAVVGIVKQMANRALEIGRGQ